MAFIGNTPTQQAFTAAVDVFSGNGSTTAFTLSRPVASVAQVEAVIENVQQSPVDAYTVSGNTITFTSAPPSGSSNIYVRYTSPITQVISPTDGSVGTNQLIAGAVTSAKLAAGAARANFGAGAVLKVQQYYDAGTSTTSTTPVSIQGARFSFTPTSSNSTLYFIHSADVLYGTGGGFASGGCYAYWYLAEYVSSDTAISPAAYLYNYQYSTTYQEVLRAQMTLQYSISNSATTTRVFNTTAATSNAGATTNIGNIRLTIIEVAN